MAGHTTARIDAVPRAFVFDPNATALVVIDMQHDFLSTGGWIDALGLDVGLLAPVTAVVATLIAAARRAGVQILYTRENYRADLADCPPLKQARATPRIGETGPRGRYMIQGEAGNAIIPALEPESGDIVIDKPGAGAFHATLLDQILRLRGISHLLVCGVTADVCVNATLYEANDRGYECLLIADATGSYDSRSTAAVVAMVANGVVGCTAPAAAVRAALDTIAQATG
jgi:nicotinamidase-related amidase